MSFLAVVGPFIPRLPGLLPKWLLFISVVSVFNSFQTYFSGLELTKKVYNNTNEVTNLSARTFGTWTLLSTVIRFYAAYHLNNPQIFDIVLSSYVIAFFHFNSEWLYYKTTNLQGKGLLGPLIVSTTTIVWLLAQRDYYLNL